MAAIRMYTKGWKQVCTIGLILVMGLLTSCGVLAQTPPKQAVKLAIVRQLTDAQRSLNQSLGIDSENITPNFKIENINIQQRMKLEQPNLNRSLKPDELYPNEIYPNEIYPDEVYRVKGTFRAKLQASGYDTSQPDRPFEIYLGTNTTDVSDDVETWFLMPSPEDGA